MVPEIKAKTKQPLSVDSGQLAADFYFGTNLAKGNTRCCIYRLVEMVPELVPELEAKTKQPLSVDSGQLAADFLFWYQFGFKQY